MKKLLCLLACMFVLLGGCTQNKANEKTICTMSIYGVEVTNTIEYDGDKVVKQTIKNTTTLDTLGIDKETLQDSLETTKGIYTLEGVTYNAEIAPDGKVSEEVSIDFTKADFKDLIKVGLVAAEESSEIAYISYETTLQALKDYGYTCK